MGLAGFVSPVGCRSVGFSHSLSTKSRCVRRSPGGSFACRRDGVTRCAIEVPNDATLRVPTKEEQEASGVDQAPVRESDDALWLATVLASRPSPEECASALSEFRADAAQKAEKAEMPTRKVEEWRFTDLRKLFGTRCVSTQASDVDSEAIAQAVADVRTDETGTTLVVVDGRFMPSLSYLDEDYDALIAAGGYVGGIDGYDGDKDRVLNTLSTKELSAETGGLFAALSAAVSPDVCVVATPPKFAFAKPLAVVYVSVGGTESESARVVAPRLCALPGEGTKLELFERHIMANRDSAPWVTSLAATAVDVAKDADVQHYILSDMPDSTSVISHVHADVNANASYKLLSLSTGGQITRFTVGIDLNEKGGFAESLGGLVADRYNVADIHSRIAHNAPDCKSNQFQKTVASDHGRAIFSGKVIVEQGAVRTDSEQLCRSMLLSTKAQIDAMPVMEIACDDVACKHGATVQDLDENQLFYCMSRGLSRTSAQELMVSSFMLELFKECPFGAFAAQAALAANAVVPTIQEMPPNMERKIKA